ncbi:MAG: hypothetical protein A2381_04945 [Bdellovibrionales bacterium RIFOXYB1_FULL_37_110]|nr:MAG: hypothetical protein A2181_00035 [Bdellovibrionales bacterium RIFOXYA1_FULL_38_20]OFZ49731.1 MAG: hypothetical protein A2417_08890 [Bdellovibrionales bacterium RIFOXYC1_FULL_37_79]OFZ59188.1 MAG: hypothetical protein A2381_04945 [Bdellovibrionales bacterium RIFOXYB1_FULL_37_110]OFZ63225.1 MAG: hypothetical protein A2328_05525 [Bdellovibrionales bacterium RIFOXYB2_FULL_36_6]OFZ63987.1 MAG: hypothetical protein A2577_12865 [Bdellovibrionales bacterium RIFOXYD1_FULL_36_51]
MKHTVHVVILLLFMPITCLAIENLYVSYNNHQFKFIKNKTALIYKNSFHQLRIPVTKCNQKFIQNFIHNLERLYNEESTTLKGKIKSAIDLQLDDKPNQSIWPKSPLGKYLMIIPNEIRALKLRSSLECKQE